jgi:predicted ABC-type transport system involved in lysophospholipase L1 biosynthesis ATPase subunit
MPPSRNAPKRKRKSPTDRAAGKSAPYARRVQQLALERAAERGRAVLVRDEAQREADRRLAEVVQEIATLRHHEARAEALTRLLEERDKVVAAQAERIAELERLLRTPTKLG